MWKRHSLPCGQFTAAALTGCWCSISRTWRVWKSSMHKSAFSANKAVVFSSLIVVRCSPGNVALPSWSRVTRKIEMIEPLFVDQKFELSDLHSAYISCSNTAVYVLIKCLAPSIEQSIRTDRMVLAQRRMKTSSPKSIPPLRCILGEDTACMSQRTWKLFDAEPSELDVGYGKKSREPPEV